MLIDSSSLIYRAFFAVPDTVRAPDGTPVNGAYGFINMVSRLIAERRPTHLACALDADWRPTWRVELIEEYKAHRVAEEPAQAEVAIDEQIDLVVELLDLVGIATAGADDYEAEDVIGTIALRTRGRIEIVSGDRDLFQLVRDPDVVVLYPVRGVSDLTVVDEREIGRRYGIPGRTYADFAILRGDPSDGLPGVRGIGAKTAAALVSTHGTLEKILEVAERTPAGPLAKIAAASDYLERAARVVRITGDAPVADADITLPTHPPEVKKVKELAERHGLTGATNRLLAAIAQPKRG